MAKQKYGEPTVMMAFRVPVSAAKAIEKKAKRGKRRKAEIAVQALQKGLGLDGKTPPETPMPSAFE